MHLTGQNEVSLEPHSPHKDFEITHAQIGHSITDPRADYLPGC